MNSAPQAPATGDPTTQNALLSSLSLLDFSGFLVIAAIVALLATGVGVTLSIRNRYASMERDLWRNRVPDQPFEHKVLNRIVSDAQEALRRRPAEINTQLIIENDFQSELKALLIGERFVKSSTGLMIILGLVGTFYGLTMSIGKLVTLVSASASSTSNIAESLTKGLTHALSGMSVAFSTSLFGIGAAIVMTLLGVFASITDRRTAIMIQIEAYLDDTLLRQPNSPNDEITTPGTTAYSQATEKLEQVVTAFAQSALQLENAVARFDSALTSFATTTRDFREFNYHLKDNIQRMSLSFGDLSETLKTEIAELKSRDRS